MTNIVLWRRCLAAAMMVVLGGGAPAWAQQQNLSTRQNAAIEELLKAFTVGDGDLQPLLTLRQTLGDAINTRVIQALRADNTLPEWGDGDGALVVEFSDYQCGYCKKMFPILQQQKVRVRMVEFPILGELSVLATRYALAAQKQNRYAEFHILLMQQRQLSEEFLQEAAATVGLDMERLLTDIDDDKISDTIRRNYQLAELLGVRGTPFLIIGDKTYRGAISREVLQGLLETTPTTQ